MRLIVALLVLLCAFSGHRTLERAWKQRAKEDSSAGGGAYKPLLTASADEEGTEMANVTKDGSSGGGGGVGKEVELAQEIAAESAFPWGSLLSLGRVIQKCGERDPALAARMLLAAARMLAAACSGYPMSRVHAIPALAAPWGPLI